LIYKIKNKNKIKMIKLFHYFVFRITKIKKNKVFTIFIIVYLRVFKTNKEIFKSNINILYLYIIKNTINYYFCLINLIDENLKIEKNIIIFSIFNYMVIYLI
jgi:hypothetical protein